MCRTVTPLCPFCRRGLGLFQEPCFWSLKRPCTSVQEEIRYADGKCAACCRKDEAQAEAEVEMQWQRDNDARLAAENARTTTTGAAGEAERRWDHVVGLVREKGQSVGVEFQQPGWMNRGTAREDEGCYSPRS
ncbi:MAG: hypothetical protein L6R39_001658 [Caloplaca ligustica]|nr:MAG: hypothetical protein L6R39_001658 [Caloplaca ligustica]